MDAKSGLNQIFKVGIASLLMLLNGACVAAGNSRDQVGNDLLASVHENYSAMTSYEDSGEVLTIYNTNDEDVREEKISFRTYLSKPDNMRIQWSKHIPLLKPRVTVLLKNSCGIYSISSRNKIEEFIDVNTALSAMAGVSGAVTSTAPRMILGNKKTGGVGVDFSAKVLKKEQIDGHSVYVLQVTYNEGVEETIWVDRDLLVIRMIEKSRMIGKSRVKESIIYNNIKYNHNIEDAIFEPESVDCDVDKVN